MSGGGEGWGDEGEVRARLEAERETERRGRIAVEIARLDLPAKDVALWRSKTATETPARAALEQPGTLLVLSGPPGCGKTTASALWLLDLVSDAGNWSGALFAYSPLWVTAARLSRWPRYDERAMASLLSATHLVVDDLGAEFVDAGGSYLTLVDELVNERYNARRPTVLTTNLQSADFKARYGERIADRVRETGRFVSLSTPSLRRRP